MLVTFIMSFRVYTLFAVGRLARIGRSPIHAAQTT
jgi:hypothetical protein